MKVGSVRFFKKLIVLTYLLMLVIPLVLAFLFGSLYAKEKQRANALETNYNALTAEYAALESPLEGPLAAVDGADAPLAQSTPSFAYQELYPHLYAQRPAEQVAEKNVCYLTFDDGPSATTLQILSTLEQEDVKATFFVTGEASEKNPDILRAIAAGGHTIGVHTYSHDYTEIYTSVEAYLEDFDKMYRTIEEITGKAPEIFRFAGGSINVYNQRVYTEIIAEMTRRGFVFYDWNAAGDDAVVGGIAANTVLNNVLSSAVGRDRVVVLLHDRADTVTSATALPGVISGLRAQGYRFAPLTNSVQPITYFYPD